MTHIHEPTIEQTIQIIIKGSFIVTFHDQLNEDRNSKVVDIAMRLAHSIVGCDIMIYTPTRIQLEDIWSKIYQTGEMKWPPGPIFDNYVCLENRSHISFIANDFQTLIGCAPTFILINDYSLLDKNILWLSELLKDYQGEPVYFEKSEDDEKKPEPLIQDLEDLHL